MIKKRGFIAIVLFVIALSATNIYLFTNEGNVSYNAISGNAIASIPKLPLDVGVSVIIFIAQWIILIIIVIIAYANFSRGRREEIIKIKHSHLKKKRTKSATDIDILYDLLKEKKRLTMGAITRTFEIDKEKALEWSKILENYNLAKIEYPTFREPELKLNEKEETKEGEETAREGSETGEKGDKNQKEKEKKISGKASKKKGKNAKKTKEKPKKGKGKKK